MSEATKIWLMIAAALVVIGLIVFTVVMAVYQWDFSRLSTQKYETNLHGIKEDFHSLSLKTDTADIIFVLSNDETCKVECYEESKAKHSVTVKDGTLVIETINEKAWYDYIGIGFRAPRITISLPKEEYAALSVQESTGKIEMPKDFQFETVDISLSTGNVRFLASVSGLTKIHSDTGDICVEDASMGGIDLSVSTGRVTVSNVTCDSELKVSVSTGKTDLTDVACQNITSTGSTGDLSLTRVIAAGKISVKRSTGDVRFDCADADEIFAQTSTGSVKGSLLTDKVFITQTRTGRIDVPQTTTGGRCEIITGTGNIQITIQAF